MASDESNDSTRGTTELERSVDEMEERVLGHTVGQERHEDDDPDAPAFEQDLDEGDASKATRENPV
ncbi:hypothetical protein [Pseudonocardia spinosispora]|uniref:hypothetical protein n=1 Tax=Pseudonocardia spinosispora TaxID=103441 RepID=UPI0003F8C482|nr:hypothetical protein [Pseudonocardia spinosispora]